MTHEQKHIATLEEALAQSLRYLVAARDERDALKHAFVALRAECDALREVADEMVERVARKLAERYSANGTTEGL